MKGVAFLVAVAVLVQVAESIVKCPDGQSACFDGMTCCQLASGQYGCCPLPNAFCCDDHLHCCPSGSHCDPSYTQCIPDAKSAEKPVISSVKLPAFALPAEEKDGEKIVKCPDGQSACFDGMTCCQLASGQYGCCPLPNAFCCDDHLHCCPSGSHCDPSYTQCIPDQKSAQIHRPVPSSLKLPAFALPAEKKEGEKIVKCPDGQSACFDGMTCCQLASGQYGCCPLPNAFCCDDHLHCCPSGSHCDPSYTQCIPDTKSAEKPVLSSVKLPAFALPAEKDGEKIVKCPDGQSACFDGMTCCQLASGQYGCCPLPNAFCCDDHLHCCPSGSHCDPSYTQCIPDAKSPGIPAVLRPAVKKAFVKN